MAGKAKTKKKKAKSASSQPAREIALLYNLDEGTGKGERVRRVLSDFDVEPKTVTKEMLNDPAGSLAGVKGMRPAIKPFDGEPPSTEFMLLCNVSQSKISNLIEGMHGADAYVGAKAVLTSHNKIWPLHILISQVSQEHSAMTKQ